MKFWKSLLSAKEKFCQTTIIDFVKATDFLRSNNQMTVKLAEIQKN